MRLNVSARFRIEIPAAVNGEADAIDRRQGRRPRDRLHVRETVLEGIVAWRHLGKIVLKGITHGTAFVPRGTSRNGCRKLVLMVPHDRGLVHNLAGNFLIRHVRENCIEGGRAALEDG